MGSSADHAFFHWEPMVIINSTKPALFGAALHVFVVDTEVDVSGYGRLKVKNKF